MRFPSLNCVPTLLHSELCWPMISIGEDILSRNHAKQAARGRPSTATKARVKFIRQWETAVCTSAERTN